MVFVQRFVFEKGALCVAVIETVREMETETQSCARCGEFACAVSLMPHGILCMSAVVDCLPLFKK